MSRSVTNEISCALWEEIDQHPSWIFAWHQAPVMIWLRNGTPRLKQTDINEIDTKYTNKHKILT